MNFRTILQLVIAFARIGLPPDPKEEAALRSWIRDLLATLAEIATITPIEYDDQIVAFLTTAVSDDTMWASLYALVDMLVDNPDADDGVLVTVANDVKTGMDPMTIIMLVKMVLELISEWRKHRQ